MKKIFTLLFVSTILFSSCSEEGPRGPEGPQGPPGEDGAGSRTGLVLDFNPVDLNAGNDYSILIDFNDQDVTVRETDAVFVYLKVDEDGTADGLPVEVFRLLPQTYYVEDGEVQYNYDFTFFDVSIFMDGTANFENLDPAYTQDQVFRVVILPASMAASLDTSNMNNVLKAMNVQEKEVKKASL
ncbi:collagen-like protein [Antarcticibacterium sp. 1MA-6-2]|uniref:collagen-like protein n=1 Tax=Antarcticibacterium sp. 1MA-6-2 TaxID=2908210 RepID=UPI001F3C1570|nr:collagen-like protein [Antarcticibacterium sp. 1MA-6-2]UJH91486.1 collagen-like protein [Antarcticibacterium sp. 1MA-6-2]